MIAYRDSLTPVERPSLSQQKPMSVHVVGHEEQRKRDLTGRYEMLNTYQFQRQVLERLERIESMMAKLLAASMQGGKRP